MLTFQQRQTKQLVGVPHLMRVNVPGSCVIERLLGWGQAILDLKYHLSLTSWVKFSTFLHISESQFPF